MQDHAGVWFPPPLLYVAMFGVAWLLQRLVPIALLPAAARPAAWLLVAGSAILTLPSLARFRRAHTSPLPIRPTTTLVIAGPYRFTRNPMYLGLLLLYTAVALWTRLTWAVLLLPALVALVDVLVITREERYLTAKFGADYERYRHRVRRWI